MKGSVKKKMQRNKGAALVVIDAVLGIALLILALNLVNTFVFRLLLSLDNLDNSLFDYQADFGVAVALMLLLAFNEFKAFLTAWTGPRPEMIRRAAGTLMLFISSMLLVFMGGNFFSSHAAMFIYGAVLISGRIFKVIKDHRARTIVINALAMLLLILFEVTVLRLILLPIVVILIAIAKAGVIAFSQINLKALKKVIRKTFAVQIIFGMVVLTIVFSVLLSSFEPDIKNFGDGLWYCFALVTTVGFGDLTVVTIIGRIISVILGFYGIIVMAVITSIIVNFYNEVKNEKDTKKEETDTEEDTEVETEEVKENQERGSEDDH